MSNVWKWSVAGLALAGFVLAVGFVLFGQVGERAAPTKPLSSPPTSPFSQGLAGAGIIEPQSENIAVGANVAGIVKHVDTQVGDRVSAGGLLVELDDRELQAEKQIQEAALLSARAELDRQQHLPRPEDVPGLAAKVKEEKANYAERTTELQRQKQLLEKGAATQQQVDTAQNALDVTSAELDKAEAELRKLQAGAWEYELQLAKAAVSRAEAELQRLETELQLLRITAPIDGEVLQVNVRPGEYVGGATSGPLFVMGETRTLHVRVDIDESDIPLYRRGAPAVAQLRGGPKRDIPLSFVLVEPFVIPKQSLTGANTERTDTRVLQVIYQVDGDQANLYVGQQVDVFFNVEQRDQTQNQSDQLTHDRGAKGPL